MYQTHII